MRTAESRTTGEPAGHRDFVRAYSAHAHENLGRALVRFGLEHPHTQDLLAVCQGFDFLAICYLNPARAQSFGALTLRELLSRYVTREHELESAAGRRFEGLATSEEHLTTLGLLAEAREAIGHIQRVLNWIERAP